jgi:prepilin-type N-terminal cleavage/methylation domain-containing protein
MSRNHWHNGSPRRFRGFSLIEVMVAVVVLATGLLAMAALQSALARNSADAKARTAVMAALTSRMSQIRQQPPAAGKTWTTADAWVSAAAVQAGTTNLQVVETVTQWNWDGTGFVTTAVADPAATFIRATLQANWTGASGSKTLNLSSDISGQIYGEGGGYPAPDANSSASKYPIVRQANPSNTPGVIPLVSGDQATAASNPQPIKVGSTNNRLVGTAFDVLNYIPEGSTAKIIKRFQTEVVKCRCKYGAGGGYSVAGEPQWPTVWDGNTYKTYNGTGSPEGVAANAGQDSAYVSQQSSECTECCRDQHDNAGNTTLESRYDPEGTGGKYNLVSGALTPVSSGSYVAACRVVKMDGIWKTAADMYARNFGMLETETDALTGRAAATGLPTDAAKNAYTTFVKDYLSQYTGATAVGPSNGQAKFDEPARNLNVPTKITIPAPSDTDERYLHTRGLYVDYLGASARKAVGDAISSCPTATPLAECILPVLPFTTINLTEMSRWVASDDTVLSVNTTKSLFWNVAQPSAGRTTGKRAGNSNNVSTIRLSNSGVAVSDDIAGGVDDNDLATFSDSQAFQVTGGGNGGGLDTFQATVTGGGNNPGVRSSLSSNGCKWEDKASAYVCSSSTSLPQTGIVTLSNYFRIQRFAENYSFLSDACTSTNGTKKFPGGSFAIPAENGHPAGLPKLINQRINGVSVNLSPLTGPWPPSRNSGLATEETDISIPSIPAPVTGVPATIAITLQDETGYVLPTLSSCTFKETGQTITIVSVTWTEAWAN